MMLEITLSVHGSHDDGDGVEVHPVDGTQAPSDNPFTSPLRRRLSHPPVFSPSGAHLDPLTSMLFARVASLKNPFRSSAFEPDYGPSASQVLGGPHDEASDYQELASAPSSVTTTPFKAAPSSSARLGVSSSFTSTTSSHSSSTISDTARLLSRNPFSSSSALRAPHVSAVSTTTVPKHESDVKRTLDFAGSEPTDSSEGGDANTGAAASGRALHPGQRGHQSGVLSPEALPPVGAQSPASGVASPLPDSAAPTHGSPDAHLSSHHNSTFHSPASISPPKLGHTPPPLVSSAAVSPMLKLASPSSTTHNDSSPLAGTPVSSPNRTPPHDERPMHSPLGSPRSEISEISL